ncbi:hypothetical protein F4827_004619 [Paraburkholderia bannensis]|uniref:LysR family transcriptional regulator n=1 Tax=Paraburkholderia bannensis TaxID=765414 RepID=A0A7W9U0U3_9BURK|nr:hypothetical protein [Paraburkholderia sp. WP4_3_2]MBB6104754.1 hypothetical protein [Paraburkholderia bannensis]
MAHEFERNALADNDVITGQIDIGCFETVAALYLPQLIAGFRERATSGLVSARLKRGQLTKPAQLFVDFCRERLASLHEARG